MSNKSISGKDLFRLAVAGSALGIDVPVNIGGTKQELLAASRAIQAVQSLTEELGKVDATVESVTEKMKHHQKCAKEFEKVTGISWPF